MFEGKEKEEMTAKMKQITLSDSTATNVSIHLQPLIRSQVTGVRYDDEAKGKFFEDVLGLLNLSEQSLGCQMCHFS